jgi:hypothetical protein
VRYRRPRPDQMQIAIISGVAHWQAGCNGYYRSRFGRVVTQWPGTMGEYRDRVCEPCLDDFATV